MTPRRRVAFLFAAVLLPAAAQAPFESFEPGVGAVPGVDGAVQAAVVFDDGSGPALYVGGFFSVAGSVFASNVARFRNGAWEAVGAGFDAQVDALVVHDDGGGPALYAGGRFLASGPTALSYVAVWSPGAGAWADVGGGVGGMYGAFGTPFVRALASLPTSAGGPTLVVGGGFSTAGGAPAFNVAAWNGASWSAPGGGFDPQGAVWSLATFASGGGAPELYAGGEMLGGAGGAVRVGLRKLSGGAWTDVGGGLGPRGAFAPIVRALHVFSAAGGPALYAGGIFGAAGAAAADSVARWDGSAWSALGAPPGVGGNSFPSAAGVVNALTTADFGAGPRLVVAGSFLTAGPTTSPHVALWDGSAFLPVNGLAGQTLCAAFGDLGAGPRLFLSQGSAAPAGSSDVSGVAAYDGAVFSALGTGLLGRVADFATYDDGTGPRVHAAVFGSGSNDGVFRRDPAGWTRIGGRFTGTSVSSGNVLIGVRGLATFASGGSTRLYAAGEFTSIGGAAAAGVAAWDGFAWTALPGAPTNCRAIAVYDDGFGEGLYTCGAAPGGTTRSLYRYDGAVWTAVGGTMTHGAAAAHVNAMAVHDDGAGPRLFCTGAFQFAGGALAHHFAAWDGSAWAVFPSGSFVGLTSNTGSYTNRVGYSLAVHDARDGAGPRLYVGGSFNRAGGVAANHVAMWNGTTFAAAPLVGAQFVLGLASFDVGAGSGLYALVPTGPQPPIYKCFRRYFGAWGDLGDFGPVSLSSSSAEPSVVRALDVGGARELWFGGAFASAGGVASPRAARYARSAPFDLALDQPGGPGSFRMRLTGGYAVAAYFTAFTFDPSNGPLLAAGNWSGLQIAADDVIAQFGIAAPPFVGALDAAGDATFTLPAGGLPPGLGGSTVYALTHAFDGTTGTVFGNTRVAPLTIQ